MAADTKRALGLGVWHGAGYYKALNLGGLREHLAAQGLHVVTQAEHAELAALRERVAKAIDALEAPKTATTWSGREARALEVLRGR